MAEIRTCKTHHSLSSRFIQLTVFPFLLVFAPAKALFAQTLQTCAENIHDGARAESQANLAKALKAAVCAPARDFYGPVVPVAFFSHPDSQFESRIGGRLSGTLGLWDSSRANLESRDSSHEVFDLGRTQAAATQESGLDKDGSTYIPVDSWIYSEVTRLYSLGYIDTIFLGMRPWTRRSLLHALQVSSFAIEMSNDDAAQEILADLLRELRPEEASDPRSSGMIYGLSSAYTRIMGITGVTLRDSFHLGQTITNDYGRPYEPGFNSIAGISTVVEKGRFSLSIRGEYQHAPSAPGYSETLAAQLSNADAIDYSGFNVPQSTIPAGPIAPQNPFRLIEATLSFHVLGHEISGGKSDAWLGPAQGGAMSWSNNAENIYSFRINRVEPLHIPLLSRILGPVRYDFFYGSLKGHTDPNDDYVHSESVSFRPTSNFEFAFQRTIIFGGAGHEPVTLHTFLYGFFDPGDTDEAQKTSRNDPGARFGDFTASYRLPFVRKFATFYVDSESHDDVSPISAPRRAGYRTGIYISQIPGLRKLDFRVEGVSTDPKVSRSTGGTFEYVEAIQRQGYTNKGFIMGDWIGREAKGGQAWLTYHLSGNEWLQVEYLNKKNDKDFIGGAYDSAAGAFAAFGGTTQNSFRASVVKRFLEQRTEINAWFQYEGWKAPIYMPGLQKNTAAVVQVTYFPVLHARP